MKYQSNLVGCYNFNDNAILIEMIIDEYPNQIDFGKFCVPDIMLEKDDWQVAYMEQFLNIDGTYKLCQAYDTPIEKSKPSRITFFIFKTEQQVLTTPYGDYSINNLEKLPDRLLSLIEFDFD